MDEQSYSAGSDMAYSRIMDECARHLRVNHPTIAREADYADERVTAIAVLRRLCKTHGDNNWPDDLHLADIIEKHLARHLQD